MESERLFPIGAKFDIMSAKVIDKGIEIEMDLAKRGEKYVNGSKARNS